jgi:hypothetical protein
MKKEFYLLFTCCSLLFASCGVTIKQVGSINMISTRNVDPKLEYVRLTTYSGAGEKELKKTRAVTIEDAINQTVKKTPGGEMLMNVKLYLVSKGKSFYFAAEGDVYGFKGEKASFRGFSVGDKVVVDGTLNRIATIKSLKDDKTCFIETSLGVVEEVKYERLSKAE